MQDGPQVPDARLVKSTRELRLSSGTDSRHLADGIVGTAPALLDIVTKIARVGPTSTPVLITGETGTGKELVARAIHRRSARAAKVMVCANLSATPVDLVSSELFGHEIGAFTGAIQRRIGRFESAHGGTLFLDEAGELAATTQVMLLRALQEGEFERVGSGQTRRSDVRIIAATNRDLGEAVAQGVFRRDLFYRLSVFPIHLPALRERRDDIPALVHHCLNECGTRIGRRFSGVEPGSMDRLVSYAWPGNIRELQNVIEYSAIMSDGGALRVPKDLCVNPARRNRVTAAPAADLVRPAFESPSAMRSQRNPASISPINGVSVEHLSVVNA